jgi:tetratricopeptide (TPR) repeat protein
MPKTIENLLTKYNEQILRNNPNLMHSCLQANISRTKPDIYPEDEIAKYFKEGITLFRTRDYKEALQIFRRLYLEFPYDSRGAQGLAQIYIHLKDYDEAFNYIWELQRFFLDEQETHILSILYFQLLKDIDSIVETALNYAKMYPENSNVLGKVVKSIYLYEPDKALNFAQNLRAIEDSPKNESLLGLTYATTGQKVKAALILDKLVNDYEIEIAVALNCLLISLYLNTSEIIPVLVKKVEEKFHNSKMLLAVFYLAVSSFYHDIGDTTKFEEYSSKQKSAMKNIDVGKESKILYDMMTSAVEKREFKILFLEEFKKKTIGF